MPDVKIFISMRRFVKEVNVKATDPIVAMPYFKFIHLDQAEKKKFFNDLEIAKHYAVSQKKTMLLNQKMVL